MEEIIDSRLIIVIVVCASYLPKKSCKKDFAYCSLDFVVCGVICKINEKYIVVFNWIIRVQLNKVRV